MGQEQVERIEGKVPLYLSLKVENLLGVLLLLGCESHHIQNRPAVLVKTIGKEESKAKEASHR